MVCGPVFLMYDDRVHRRSPSASPERMRNLREEMHSDFYDFRERDVHVHVRMCLKFGAWSLSRS